MWTKWTAQAAEPACSSPTDSGATDSGATAKKASDNMVYIRPRSRLSPVGTQRCRLSPIRRIGMPESVRRERGQTEGKFPHACIVEFAARAASNPESGRRKPGLPDTCGPNSSNRHQHDADRRRDSTFPVRIPEIVGGRTPFPIGPRGAGSRNFLPCISRATRVHSAATRRAGPSMSFR